MRALFVEFVPGKVSASEVARCVDRLLPELLAKSGDPSPRIHTLAQHTILTIAACPEVREQHLIAPALSRSVGTGTHPRLALSRMQMLEQLALSQGINADKQSGLTCRALSDCGCSGKILLPEVYFCVCVVFALMNPSFRNTSPIRTSTKSGRTSFTSRIQNQS